MIHHPPSTIQNRAGELKGNPETYLNNQYIGFTDNVIWVMNYEYEKGWRDIFTDFQFYNPEPFYPEW